MPVEKQDRELLNRHLEYMNGLDRGQAFTRTSNALAAVAESREEAERQAEARIVAWLREQAKLDWNLDGSEVRSLAKAIERGDHRQSSQEGQQQ